MRTTNWLLGLALSVVALFSAPSLTEVMSAQAQSMNPDDPYRPRPWDPLGLGFPPVQPPNCDRTDGTASCKYKAGVFKIEEPNPIESVKCVKLPNNVRDEWAIDQSSPLYKCTCTWPLQRGKCKEGKEPDCKVIDHKETAEYNVEKTWSTKKECELFFRNQRRGFSKSPYACPKKLLYTKDPPNTEEVDYKKWCTLLPGQLPGEIKACCKEPSVTCLPDPRDSTKNLCCRTDSDGNPTSDCDVVG